MSILYTPSLDRYEAGEGFYAMVDGYMLGAATLNRCASVRQGFSRTKEQIGRDGIQNYMIQIFRKGRCHAHTRHGELVMRSGDICIFDNTQPLDTVNDDFDLLALVVPRERLAPLLHDPDGVHYGCVRKDNPLARLFRSHLAELYRSAPTMRTEHAAGILSSLIHFLATVINGGLDLTREHNAPIRHDLIQRVRRHVDANLESGQLQVADLATGFGISRTRFYSLFEPHGGVAAYVQRRRLAVAYARLTDPLEPRLSINAIAASVGFQSESAFIRAFRRRYGMTPGAARRGKGVLPLPVMLPDGPPHERSWSNWLARL